MTFYEIFVPIVALVLAGAGVAFVHMASKRLDRNTSYKHPAE